MKPILHVDDTGHLVNVGKIKGRRASLSQLVEKVEQTAVRIAEQTIFISHGDCPEDAELLAKMIRKTTPCKRHYYKSNWSRYWFSLRSRYACCIFSLRQTINKNSHTVLVWLFLCSWNVRSAFLS